MARIFQDGFENNDTSATRNGYDTFAAGTGTTAPNTTNVRSGTYALQVLNPHGSNPTGALKKWQSSSGGGPFFLRAYFLVVTLPSASSTIMYFSSSTSVGSTLKGGISLETDGTLKLRSGNGTQIGSASSAINDSNWHMLELKVDHSLSSGSRITEGRLDGTVFATSSSETDTNVLAFAVGGNLNAVTDTTTGGEWWIDDVALNDSTGSSQTDYPGPGNIITLRPNAQGDSNGWTTNVGGTAGAANNYTRVDEVTPNDNTDYNGAAFNGTTDMFNMDDSGIGASDTVNVVQVNARFKNPTADVAAAVKFQVEKTSAGTKAQSAAIVPDTTSWNTNATAVPRLPVITLYADPDGAAWTQTTLDSMQAGYTITTTGSNGIDVSALWVTVDYTPAGGGGTTVTNTQPAVARIAVNDTSTQPAVARIANNPTETQPAVARVSNSLAVTQPAVSRISTTPTKTQPAVARIQKIVTKTQTATARIANPESKTQSAIARIANSRTKTQSAVARVANNKTKTQPVISRIAVIATKTQPSLARIVVNASKTQSATAHIVQTTAASISTLVDALQDNTFNTGLWNKGNVAGDVVNTNNELEITIPSGVSLYNFYGSNSQYDWTGAGASVRVKDPGDQTIVSQEAGINFHIDGSNQLWTFIGDGVVKAFQQVGGVQTQIGTSITYVAASHKFLRIRESAGTFYFDSSPDALTWTNNWSVANPFSGNTVGQALIYSQHWQSEATTTVAKFDNFNTWQNAATQPATARIAVNSTKTQAAIARIAVKPSKVQPAVARVAVKPTKTQGAIARISQPLIKTQPAVARVSNTRAKAQSAVSRIATIPTKTQPARARIATSVTKTQSATAHIVQATPTNLTNTQPAVARIANIRSKTQPAISRISVKTSRTQPAIARVAVKRTATQAATARTGITRTASQTARANIGITRTAAQTATAHIIQAPPTSISIIAEFYNPSIQVAFGLPTVAATFTDVALSAGFSEPSLTAEFTSPTISAEFSNPQVTATFE